MAKRTYDGSPLDFTMKSIGDSNGSTEGGTTEDDYNEVNTDVLPDDVSAEQLNSDHWEIINYYLTSANRDNPDYAEITESIDADLSKQAVKRWIHRIFRGDRDISDVPTGKQLAIGILGYHGADSSASKLADMYPVSKSTISHSRKIYPDLIENYTDISKEQLDSAVEKYKETNSYKAGKGREKAANEDKEVESNSEIRRKIKELYQSGVEASKIAHEMDVDDGIVYGHIGSLAAVGEIEGSENTRNESEDITEYKSRKRIESYPDKFTELQEAFIEEISSNPWKNAKEVAKSVNKKLDRESDSGNYYYILREWPEVVRKRIEEKESVGKIEDMNDSVADKIDVDDLTLADGAISSSESEQASQQSKNDELEIADVISEHCDCDGPPELKVQTAVAGPTSIQSLFCRMCDQEIALWTTDNSSKD